MDDLCDLALTSVRLRVKRVIPPSCRHQRDLFIRVSCKLVCQWNQMRRRHGCLAPASFRFLLLCSSSLGASLAGFSGLIHQKKTNKSFSFPWFLFLIFLTFLWGNGQHITFVHQQTDLASHGWNKTFQRSHYNAAFLGFSTFLFVQWSMKRRYWWMRLHLLSCQANATVAFY